jgi:ParB family chromosome partitioning protein
MSPDKPRRLGRGLEALIGGAPPGNVRSPDIAPAATNATVNELKRIPLTSIRPNPFQPRREFAESELAELRASLSASGMLQPVVVRSVGQGFELISGERRFRAAGQLGWKEIPALVREADERTMLTLALIENLQRADLNAVEEARGYQRLHDEFQLTHQQIAEAVGKERSTVSNLLRLLALPPQVQLLLEQGKLTMGHARALLAVEDPRAALLLATEIANNGLSVRDAERRVRELATPRPQTTAAPRRDAPAATGTSTPSNTAAVRQIEDSLRKRFQTDIKIQIDAANKGTIQISFYSADDLNRLLELFTKRPEIGD